MDPVVENAEEDEEEANGCRDRDLNRVIAIKNYKIDYNSHAYRNAWHFKKEKKMK